MDIVLVRHGESEGNADGRLQGRRDSPLSARGREQAARLGAWLAAQGISWSHAYASPLARAAETASIASAVVTGPVVTLDPDLQEIDAGELSGLNRAEMIERFPAIVRRPPTSLGEFAEFGGEGYDDVQARVARFVARIVAAHRATGDRLLVVAHGGFNLQLVKALVCHPVPRLMLLRYGNCAATELRGRERQGQWLWEIAWHVPLELMGPLSPP